jgi:glycosyltransferase involved in cell wall biosynthesis
MKKLKVVHIITLLEMGGAQGNTLFTVAHLDRERFDVILISGKGGILDEEAKKTPNLKTYFIENLVRSIHPLKDFLCLLELRKILKEEKPDIVHTHSSKAGILGRVAAYCAGVPVIIHSIHGFGFNPYQMFFIRQLFIFLERQIAKITHCLIAVSNENAGLGMNLGIGRENQYTLIRSGVDIEEIRKRGESARTAELRRTLEIPEKAKIVLSVGPLKIQKDPVSFVVCAEKVIHRFPQARFLWVGDGELKAKVEERIRKLGLQSQVRILGWRNDVPEILSCCEVFALTSLWEGLPRAAVEALILKKPVVAFRVDGIPEIVKDGENGFLVPPGSLEEFSSKLLQILKDEELSKRLSSCADKTIDKSFDIREMIRQQEALYKNLLKSS